MALTTKVNGTWMFTKVRDSVNIPGVPFQDSLKTIKSKGKCKSNTKMEIDIWENL
jgi:hypothetical protein